jgi:hypothetical protein
METLPTIIGITGRKFHGKDTLADYLVKQHGYIKLSFAQPLKEICKTIFGFTNSQVNGDLKETIDFRWDVTPRKVMQFIGTELFRDNIGRLLPDIGENLWARCVIEKIKSLLLVDPSSKFVISDVRFPNEIECLREYSKESKIFRVYRPGVLVDETSSHPSEKLIDSLSVDADIINDSDKDSLFLKFEALF